MTIELDNHYALLRSLLTWYTKHRREGLPIQYHDDADYQGWFYQYRRVLKRFRNIHQGEDCFIIGNGPSLSKMDLSRLNGYHLFGLNKIHLIFDKHPLQLSYHVTVNRLVTEQIKDELDNNAFGCSSFLSYHASKQFSYKNKNVHRLLTNGPWSFSKSITVPVSEGYTVTYLAMQIAYFMGFNTIYLIGVDHNYKQLGKPNEQQHYKGDDVNHFHPDYFKGHQWHLADIEGNEASYALAKHHFHSDGREIYDATVDGKLTIFKKVAFEDAIKMAQKKRNEKVVFF